MPYCQNCRRKFNIVENIPSFLEEQQPQAETCKSSHIYTKSLTGRLKSRLSPHMRFMQKHMKERGDILDLGCGGGNAFYPTIGRVAGLDVSMRSLMEAKKLYSVVVHADAAKLPFADESFDYVVSWDLIGHISKQNKDKLISEIYRVLREGGKTIHYMETLGDNAVELFARKYPDLYDRYFINQDGHIGLEPPRDALKRFTGSGFALLDKKPRSFTILRFPEEYLKRFDNEYKRKSLSIRILVIACRLLIKMKPLRYLAELFVIFSERLAARFFPFDNAGGVYICCEKNHIKICFVSGAYPPLRDGIGDYTFRLLRALQKQTVKISLITSDIDGIEKAHDNIDILPVIKKWNTRAVWAILRLVKKESFDIVHIQYPSARYRKTIMFAFLPFFIRLFFKNTKVITTLHEFSVAHPINRARQILLARFSHQVIVSDKGELVEMAKSIPDADSKTRVIPIGSNIDVWAREEEAKEAVRKEANIIPGAAIISYFGFMHRNKGIESLLEAIAELRRRDRAVFLFMITELDAPANAYHREISGLVRHLGIDKLIYWTGYREPEKISQFLSASDICVLPFKDGATLRRGTLMAALLHGLPVISTTGKAVSSELKHGENVYLIPADDPTAAAEAIEDLIKDDGLRRRLSGSARELSKRFMWERIAESHREAYRDLAGESI